MKLFALGISFRPRLLDCLRDYSKEKFVADLAAGLTVGIVALPLAMAFGIASGVKPENGIFTAVFAGFLISALGGSRVQIGGPTGAFIVIVYGIIAQYGLENLMICTVMAGIILLLLGLTKMGSMIKYIPYPVTVGFTSGIAVLIFSTQIKDFLGLRMEKSSAAFLPKLKEIALHLSTFHPVTLGLATVSLLIILFWPKSWSRYVPGSIIAVIFGTLAVAFLHLPVETIGTKFGGIPQSLPHFKMPDLSLENIQHLLSPAVTIAILAAIESLLSAVVADGMTGDRHDSNQELMAQGIANIVCPFFGGIPATGAIARTATNVRSGAVSPIAGIIHSLELLAILLVAAPWAKHIPLATLAAVLVVVAWNMGEWHALRRLPLLPKSDASVLLITFTLTVLADLTVAVEIGMIMAAMLFIKRVSETTQITAVDGQTSREGDQYSVVGKEVPQGVMIYQIFGAFLFGAAEKLETALKEVRQEPNILLLQVHKVVAMDATGLNALESLHERLKSRGKWMILCGPHTQPYMVMSRAGFLDRLGEENVVADLDSGLARAREILEKDDF